MSELKHTPGPWYIADSDVDYSPFKIIGPRAGCNMNGVKNKWCLAKVGDDAFWNSKAFRQQDLANARLIAAAPTLLTACERALSYLTNANASEPEEVVSAIIDAMVLAGSDRAALEECAKATWHPFQSESKGPSR